MKQTTLLFRAVARQIKRGGIRRTPEKFIGNIYAARGVKRRIRKLYHRFSVRATEKSSRFCAQKSAGIPRKIREYPLITEETGRPLCTQLCGRPLLPPSDMVLVGHASPFGDVPSGSLCFKVYTTAKRINPTTITAPPPMIHQTYAGRPFSSCAPRSPPPAGAISACAASKSV